MASLPSAPPTSTRPDALAISTTARSPSRRQPASTRSPSGPVTERVAVGAAEHVECSLAAVGHRGAVALPSGRGRGAGHRLGHLRRSGRPPELVWGGQPHWASRYRGPNAGVGRGLEPRPPVVHPRPRTVSSRRAQGAGGLVSGLGPLVAGTDALWLAAAITDADRDAASQGRIDAEGFRLRTLALDPDDYRMAYDVVSQRDAVVPPPRPLRPAPDGRASTDGGARHGTAYRRVNHGVRPRRGRGGAGGRGGARPGLPPRPRRVRLASTNAPISAACTSCTRPSAGRTASACCPTTWPSSSCRAWPPIGRCGFHTARWARAFVACCRDVIGTEPDTFVAPLAPDPDDCRRAAATEECRTARRRGSRSTSATAS